MDQVPLPRPQQLMQGNWPTNLSCASAAGPNSSPQNLKYMPKCPWHTLQQNKRAVIKHETEKNIFPGGDAPSTGCVSSLPLGKEVFQAQGPFLCSPVGAERPHWRDSLSKQKACQAYGTASSGGESWSHPWSLNQNYSCQEKEGLREWKTKQREELSRKDAEAGARRQVVGWTGRLGLTYIH